MRLRKLTTLCVALVVLFSCATVAFARWTNTDTFDISMVLSSNYANCGVQILAVPGASRIEGTSTLYKVNADYTRTYLTSWVIGVNSDNMAASHGYYVPKGTYCYEFSGRVYANGMWESLYAHVDGSN